MTREEIINQIARDKEYMAICRLITGKRADMYADDLYQELILIIMKLPEDKLQELYASCFRCYYYRVAEKQFKSDTSDFYNKYIKPTRNLRKHSERIKSEESANELDGSTDPQLVKLLNRAMGELPFVDARILEIYAEKKSIPEVASESGIPRRSLYNIIANARDTVRIKIKRYKRQSNE